MQVYPSDILPLVRSFLNLNGYSSTVAALDKELAKNKVAIDKDNNLDLLEACRAYMQEVKAKASNGKEKRKAEDEANSKKTKKAKVEKEESDDSDSGSSSEEEDTKAKKDKKAKQDKKEESDSSSSESDSSDSESSESESSDSDSSESDSDSDSESSESESSGSESSDSDSSSGSSSEEETKKSKKDKKNKNEANGKAKEDKEDKAATELPTTPKSLPTTPKSNGYHTPETVTPTSSKKNTPFRRVTDEDAVLLNDKFADNTFESKKGDEYGRQASVILSKTRGDKFRSEKGKKKKSYRSSGAIDTGINSVKFEYDD